MKTITLIFLSFLLACNGNKNEATKAKQDSTVVSKQADNTSGFKPNENTTGAYEDKYPNGITKTLGNYRFGKKDGIWAVFYPDGKIWSENQYKNDSLNGFTNTYFETGQKRYTGFYKNNQPSGVWQFFDTTGKVIQEKKY
jgi:antitoxin component YwqK of YwqJK toxin-antitoxin module